MRVILQEKIANLGDIGTQVMVSRGYARNYLIPLGKAVPATDANMAEFEKHREDLEKRAVVVLTEARQRAEKLTNTVVIIESQAGEEGKLFGSVGPRDVANAATKSGIELAKSEVRMPQGPIRQLGEYDIDVQLHSEVAAVIKVKVVPQS